MDGKTADRSPGSGHAESGVGSPGGAFEGRWCPPHPCDHTGGRPTSGHGL